MSLSRSMLSGPLILIGGALALVVFLQVWLLYRVETALRATDTRMPIDAPVNDADNASGRDVAVRPDPLLQALARIESRLAMLEAQREPPVPHVVAAPKPVVAGSAEALAADRELAAMLPSQPMSMPDFFALQGRIGALPAERQRQLSAALARAVNDGRAQVRQE